MLKIKIDEKRFADKLILKNIDLQITKPGLYGLVGKNGAGKTTLFQCLLQQTDFKGTVLFKDNPLPTKEILWCATEPFLYDELTGAEFIEFYSLLTTSQKPKNSNYFFDIPEAEFIGNYSTGMKKKTYLNALLVKPYKIYLLDEPFNGLDIESNIELYKFLQAMAKDKIVIISSHILESLYTHCERIFLLKKRQIKSFKKEEYHEITGYFTG